MSSPSPSPRLLRGLAVFGLTLDRATGLGAAHRRVIRCAGPGLVEHIERCEGRLVFINGPSGGGKSTLLRAVAREARCIGGRVVWARAAPPGVAWLGAARRYGRRSPPPRVIDMACRGVSGSAVRAGLARLASAGLGEAALIARRVDELSDGQRWRMALAAAMMRAERSTRTRVSQRSARRRAANQPVWILADEFASLLDRATARNLAAAVRRWIDRQGAEHAIRLIVATSHDDLVEALNPDLLVNVDAEGNVMITPRVEQGGQHKHELGGN